MEEVLYGTEARPIVAQAGKILATADCSPLCVIADRTFHHMSSIIQPPEGGQVFAHELDPEE